MLFWSLLFFLGRQNRVSSQEKETLITLSESGKDLRPLANRLDFLVREDVLSAKDKSRLLEWAGIFRSGRRSTVVYRRHAVFL